MTITPPDSMKDEIEAKAKAAGMPVDADLVHLVLANDPEAEEEYDVPGPPELTFHNREELERLLDEGLNSGPGVLAGAAFWEERKRVLADRMAKRRGEGR